MLKKAFRAKKLNGLESVDDDDHSVRHEHAIYGGDLEDRESRGQSPARNCISQTC